MGFTKQHDNHEATMRLKYFIICLIGLTNLSMVYTWQQIEIIKLAYVETNKNKVYKELLDRNHYLRYNLISLKSALNLGNKLLDGTTNFELPQASQVMILVLPGEKPQDQVRDGAIQLSQVGVSPLETVRQPEKVKKFLMGFTKGRFVVSIAKLQNVLPLRVKTFINKQAQAQDFNKR